MPLHPDPQFLPSNGLENCASAPHNCPSSHPVRHDLQTIGRSGYHPTLIGYSNFWYSYTAFGRDDMSDKSPRPFFLRRWFLIGAVSLAITGGAVAEFGLRDGVKIAGPAAEDWIQHSPIVRSTAGDIRSLSIARSRSNFSYHFDGTKSGRIHYIVHGSKEDLDLFVLWEEKPHNTAPKIIKVQWIDTKGFDTIWP
jgi:hypothetical protein